MKYAKSAKLLGSGFVFERMDFIEQAMVKKLLEPINPFQKSGLTRLRNFRNYLIKPTILNSVLRFEARPSTVSFVAIGSVSP